MVQFDQSEHEFTKTEYQIFILLAEASLAAFGSKVVVSTARNTKVYKICTGSYMFIILQTFATKLCSVTNFNTLFLASCGDKICSSCINIWTACSASKSVVKNGKSMRVFAHEVNC